jgi:hypothetical protein
MAEPFLEKWEQQVKETAASFPYPPTPDIATAVRWPGETQRRRPARSRPRLAWAIALLLFIIAGLLAVPQVRAAVARLFRIGAITIIVTEPAPTATAVPAGSIAAPDTVAIPPTATPMPAEDVLFNLAGETTLSDVQARANFPISVPTYPDDLGMPDRVFYQPGDGWPHMAILVWMEPGSADNVRFSLYHIAAREFAYKGAQLLEETTVDGQRAFYIQGSHLLQLQDGSSQPWLFVDGNVLIWWADSGITYRLESDLSLEEARRVAESLVELPQEE